MGEQADYLRFMPARTKANRKAWWAGVLAGGQVGYGGHMETCDDVILIAQTGIARSVSRPGIYFGSPARERWTVSSSS